MKCKSCGFVDHSTIYASNPPEFKCEKYGCIVNVDSTCKGEDPAETVKNGDKKHGPENLSAIQSPSS